MKTTITKTSCDKCGASLDAEPNYRTATVEITEEAGFVIEINREDAITGVSEPADLCRSCALSILHEIKGEDFE
jgi:hypothetical protein